MRVHARHLFVSACVAAAAAQAHAAGAVDVEFVNPERFADAGATPRERQDNLRVIAQHLQALGQRHLQAAEVLKVEVIDVDLAGHVRPVRRRSEDVRITNGMSDWPKISVRYTLQANGRVVRGGEESIADMNYLGHVAGYQPLDPLGHEKQMLDRWFKSRFALQRAQAD